MTRFDIDSLDNRDPHRIDVLSRLIHEPLRRYFRAEVRGLERIPPDAALMVGNHSGGMLTVDSFIFFSHLYRARGMDYMPYGLGHEVAISMPVIDEVVVPLGAVRAGHDAAHRVFERGHKVMVYPGGDEDNQRPFRHRNRIVFGGRTGYIRLALREGVPVVPIVSAGSHATLIIVDDMRWLARGLHLEKRFRLKVLPLSLSVPWGLTVGPIPAFVPLPSKILIEALEPMHFERCGEEAAADDAYVRQCADRVENAMQATLGRLAAERRRKRWGFRRRI